MATVILNCTSAPNSSTFKNSSSIRITYTAENGTFKLTEIEGKRTDGYHTYHYDTKKLTVTVNGTAKTVSVTKVDFNSSYVAFKATDTSWTGITSGSFSIKVETPDGSLAHQDAVFQTSSNVSMSYDTYTVKYDANGGVGAPSSQTKTYGTALTLSSTRPTRASIQEGNSTISYTFKGWATSKTSSTVSYSPGGSYTKNASITLYAVWSTTSTINKYDVVYDTGTGVVIPSQTKIKGTTLTLTSTTPSKPGFSFSKWNTKEDGTGTSYNPGGSYTVDSDILLFAIYTPWTHTVSFNANGGDSSSLPSSFTKTGGQSAFIPTTVPTRNGYIFRCWNTASNNSGTVYWDGDEYSADKNGGSTTLYAIWSLNDIRIYPENKKCEAIEFIEDSSLLGFKTGSIVSAGEFIEGSSISIKSSGMTFTEIIEK